MVAYSFKECFVNPIRVGLGQLPATPDVPPKRQTIRNEGKRRHVEPDHRIQLYCGLRTKKCFSIGVARCTSVQPIYIQVESGLIVTGRGRFSQKITKPLDLDAFARRDGFANYEDFGRFWYEEHHATMNDFHGVLIEWEPL